MKEMYLKLFGESWGKALSETLDEDAFVNLGLFIKSERQKTTVYPQQEDIFKAFHLTSFEDTKVVILGMDPYINEGQATGLSFAVPNGKSIPPSLRIIKQELESSYRTTITEFDSSMENWAKQGVLMLNTALTVRHKESGSHLKEWSPFTEAVFKALNKKINVIWILLGKDAQNFDKFIDLGHLVFRLPHPMSEIYKPNSGFIGSNVFKEVNQILTAMNKSVINWINTLKSDRND